MEYESIKLWKEGTDESMLFRATTPIDGPKPAMLVIPGGGYSCVCHDWEGTPIAERFEKLGFRVFILRYRVSPHRFPEPQQDAIRAMKLIRGNAAKWGVIPDNIAVVGFSAGGHLACTLGTICPGIKAEDGDEFDAVDPMPNGSVLSYSVITGGEKAHRGSVDCLMGSSTPENVAQFSLEDHVSEKTPPAYIWATMEDGCVPAENSIGFALAMKNAGRPCELHIFPHGQHGIQLGKDFEDIPSWPEEATLFLRTTCGFKLPK